MGSQPWMYAVPYEVDLQSALDGLKQREFQAGRYYPAIEDITTSYIHPENMHGPGAQHASIEEALEASGESGTQSVLDMVSIGSAAGPQTVVPLDDPTLLSLFGTTHPTRAMVDRSYRWLNDAQRGEGVAVLLYGEDGTPLHVLFAGYSFD
jgi:hypothetical protein